MTQANTSLARADAKVYLGSTLLLTWMTLTTFIFGPLVLLCGGMPFSVRYALANTWVRMAIWMARICCGVHYQIQGLDNIKDTPVAIVLSKHQSAWETIALRLFLPPQTALLKESLVKIPVWGWALAQLRPIAIDRSNQRAALKALLKQGRECLDDGLWVVVFPEGTRAAPGENKKFNAGGAILAEKTGYPVIPIAHNAGHCWGRNSFLKYPGMITVKIGPPITTQGRKAADINQEAADWIAEAMVELDQMA